MDLREPWLPFPPDNGAGDWDEAYARQAEEALYRIVRRALRVKTQGPLAGRIRTARRAVEADGTLRRTGNHEALCRAIARQLCRDGNLFAHHGPQGETCGPRAGFTVVWGGRGV